MKKITGILIALLMAVTFLAAQNVETKDGYDKLVKYLKNNKEFLQYKKVSVINDSGMKAVEIITQKNRQKDIIDTIGKYKIADSNITVLSATEVKITVLFRHVALVAEKAPAKCPGKVTVQVRELVPETLNVYHYGNGLLKPANQVEVKAAAAGTVKVVEAAVGTAVKKGDVIVRFNSEALAAELKKAESEAARWNRKLRIRRGWKVRSKRAEATAEKKIRIAESTIADTKKKIDDNSVRAEIDGVVEAVKAEAGAACEAGAVIAVVVNKAKLKVDAGSAKSEMRNGTAAGIKINGKMVKGVVENGFIVVDNSAGKLEAGKTVNFRVFKRAYESISVIDSALVSKDDEGSFIYIVEPVKRKRAKKVYVTEIASDNGLTAVDGVNAGDEIIFKGIPCLMDGKKVRIVEVDPSTGELVKVKKSGRKVKVKKVEKKKAVSAKKPVKVKKASKPVDSSWHKMKAGVNFSFLSMTADNFKDIYGSGQVTFGADFGYMITDRIEAWASVGFGSKSKNLTEMNNAETKFSFKPVIAIDGRYHFFRKNNFSAFAGGGLSIYMVKDKVDSADVPEVSETIIGGNLLAGAQYKVGKNIYLQGLFRYNFVSKTKDSWDYKLDLNGGEVLIGVGFGF